MNIDYWTWLGRISDCISLILFLAVFFAYLKRENIRRWLTRNRFPKEVGHPLGNDIQFDALIFTISRTEVPFWVIEQLKPRYIGLIATQQSREVAEEIKAFAKNRQTDTLIETIQEPDDPAQSRFALQNLLEGLRKLNCQTIAVELTGGKVTMSLGAFMAAEELGLHSLYVSTQFDRNLNKPDMRTAKILCVSRPH